MALSPDFLARLFPEFGGVSIGDLECFRGDDKPFDLDLALDTCYKWTKVPSDYLIRLVFELGVKAVLNLLVFLNATSRDPELIKSVFVNLWNFLSPRLHMDLMINYIPAEADADWFGSPIPEELDALRHQSPVFAQMLNSKYGINDTIPFPGSKFFQASHPQRLREEVLDLYKKYWSPKVCFPTYMLYVTMMRVNDIVPALLKGIDEDIIPAEFLRTALESISGHPFVSRMIESPQYDRYLSEIQPLVTANLPQLWASLSPLAQVIIAATWPDVDTAFRITAASVELPEEFRVRFVDRFLVMTESEAVRKAALDRGYDRFNLGLCEVATQRFLSSGLHQEKILQRMVYQLRDYKNPFVDAFLVAHVPDLIFLATLLKDEKLYQDAVNAAFATGAPVIDFPDDSMHPYRISLGFSHNYTEINLRFLADKVVRSGIEIDPERIFIHPLLRVMGPVFKAHPLTTFRRVSSATFVTGILHEFVTEDAVKEFVESAIEDPFVLMGFINHHGAYKAFLSIMRYPSGRVLAGKLLATYTLVHDYPRLHADLVKEYERLCN